MSWGKQQAVPNSNKAGFLESALREVSEGVGDLGRAGPVCAPWRWLARLTDWRPAGLPACLALQLTRSGSSFRDKLLGLGALVIGRVISGLYSTLGAWLRSRRRGGRPALVG